MSWVDLTHPLSERTPTWEDAELYQRETVCTIDSGCPVRVSRITSSTHNGTHLDAPAHFLEHGRFVEDLSLDVLVGPAWIAQTADAAILDAPLLESLHIPPTARRILFKTANSKRRLMHCSKFSRDYVGLETSGAQWLVDRGVMLVGLDYLSVQAYTASDDTHRILLANDSILVEGLDLDRVSTGWWDLVCLPLLARELDGAPARVIARAIP
ncbi:MAG: cyclase family protein [Fibrobacteres bacterium]|nr:cyclase family protein [Fibrobacterota bacterium]